MDMKITPKTLGGLIEAVPSKSVLHRALICAALAEGESRIKNCVLSKDIMATAGALRALGATVVSEGSDIIVQGMNFEQDAGMSSRRDADISFKQNTSMSLDKSGAGQGNLLIDCGESGSTLRFMIPVVAALGARAEFTGEGQLPTRPLKTYFEVLGQKSMTFEHPETANLPLTIEGKLASGHYAISGSVSSQYITGLLLALPICEGDSDIVVEQPFESKGYVDITLDVMKSFGVLIEDRGGAYHIRGGQKYKPCDYVVEGDWSQSAVWLCAAAIKGEIGVEGMNPNSKQGDAEVIKILRRFGAEIEWQRNGVITATARTLSGILIDAAQIPDIIPALAVVAAFARGKTKIINAGRLRFKESDRLAATAEVLNQLGADVKIDCDSLIINGRPKLLGGAASGYNDHRIVMALAIAACGCKEPVTIEGYGCISKSYPHFFDDYRKLGGEANGIDNR